MSKRELTSLAAAVVIGKVVKVTDVGKSFSDHCYVWQQREATFRVASRSKGTTAPTIAIRFRTRLRDANPSNPCDGGRTSYHLSKGARYQLYLGRSGKGRAVRYHMINWAGVKRL